jgi:hypothetical protein
MVLLTLQQGGLVAPLPHPMGRTTLMEYGGEIMTTLRLTIGS